MENKCLWQAYSKRAKELANGSMLTARSIVLIARGYALVNNKDLGLFEALSDQLLRDKSNAKSSGVDIFKDQCSSKIKNLDGSQLVLLVTALSRLDLFDGPLLLAIAKAIRPLLPSLDPRGLGAFANGYATLAAGDCVPQPAIFWKEVASAAVPKLGEFELAAVGLFVHSFALLKHDVPSMSKSVSDLLPAAAGFIPQFDASSLSFFVNAMARLSYHEPTALSAVKQRIEDGCLPRKPSDIAQLTSGLGRLDVRLTEAA